MLGIGETAPTFQLTAQDKSKFDSRELAGSRLVVVFYPAAFTGVCTEEMCTFADLMADLENSGANVVGISVDAHFPMLLSQSRITSPSHYFPTYTGQ